MSESLNTEDKLAIHEKLTTHEQKLLVVERDITDMKKDIDDLNKKYEVISDLAYSVRSLVDKFDTLNASVKGMEQSFTNNICEIKNDQDQLQQTVLTIDNIVKKDEDTKGKWSNIKWNIVGTIIQTLTLALLAILAAAIVPGLPIG